MYIRGIIILQFRVVPTPLPAARENVFISCLISLLPDARRYLTSLCHVPELHIMPTRVLVPLANFHLWVMVVFYLVFADVVACNVPQVWLQI